MTDSTAIAVRNDGPAAIVPRSFEEAKSLAEYMRQSALIPAALARGGGPAAAANICAIVMAGAELGLAPMSALRSFHIIEGVPKLTSHALVAVILARRDVCEYFTVIEHGAERVTFETKRVNAPAPVRISWDLARAKAAGKIDASGKGCGANAHNWNNYRPNMLAARCKSELANLVYPDIVAGLQSVEEYQDDPGDPIATVGQTEVFAKPADPPAAAPAAGKAAAKPPAAAKTPPPAASSPAPASAPPPPPAPSPPPAAAAPPAASQPPPAAKPAAPPPPPPAPAPEAPNARARADYDASAARVAAANDAPPAEPPIEDAEVVSETKTAPDDFGDADTDPLPSGPPDLIAHVKAFRAAAAIDTKAAAEPALAAARAKALTWSKTTGGQPHAQALKAEYLKAAAAVEAKS